MTLDRDNAFLCARAWQESILPPPAVPTRISSSGPQALGQESRTVGRLLREGSHRLQMSFMALENGRGYDPPAKSREETLPSTARDCAVPPAAAGTMFIGNRVFPHHSERSSGNRYVGSRLPISSLFRLFGALTLSLRRDRPKAHAFSYTGVVAYLDGFGRT